MKGGNDSVLMWRLSGIYKLVLKDEHYISKLSFTDFILNCYLFPVPYLPH